MKIKVGDKVKLRNGFQDLIIAKIQVEKLDDHSIGISSLSGAYSSYFHNKDIRECPFLTKSGHFYTEEGYYHTKTNRPPGINSHMDIVEIIKEKKKVKKYYWVMVCHQDGELCCSRKKYPNSSNPPTEETLFSDWSGVQIIEPTEEEFEEDA